MDRRETGKEPKLAAAAVAAGPREAQRMEALLPDCRWVPPWWRRLRRMKKAEQKWMWVASAVRASGLLPADRLGLAGRPPSGRGSVPCPCRVAASGNRG